MDLIPHNLERSRIMMERYWNQLYKFLGLSAGLCTRKLTVCVHFLSEANSSLKGGSPPLSKKNEKRIAKAEMKVFSYFKRISS